MSGFLLRLAVRDYIDQVWGELVQKSRETVQSVIEQEDVQANLLTKGSADSGNYGHAGNPGHVGGSGKGDKQEGELAPGEKDKIERETKEMVQGIWDKNFPGQKVKIETECKEEDDKIRLSAEFSAKGFSGGTIMVATIYPDVGTIIHDDYFLDDDRFKGKGFASSYMRYVEKVAEDHGCTKAILQASDQGRYTWPQLGFKCESRSQFREIQAFGRSKGIDIKNEKDFIKLRTYFDKSKSPRTPWSVLNEDILMKKPVGLFPTKKKELEERVVKKAVEQPLTVCPKCGEALVLTDAGLWCVNPDCEVTDDPYDFIW